LTIVIEAVVRQNDLCGNKILKNGLSHASYNNSGAYLIFPDLQLYYHMLDIEKI
jgi:hypothetical protein